MTSCPCTWPDPVTAPAPANATCDASASARRHRRRRQEGEVRREWESIVSTCMVGGVRLTGGA